jgi:hypothetical protein
MRQAHFVTAQLITSERQRVSSLAAKERHHREAQKR